ncbi:MAG: hypothetical protein ACYCXT_07675 [Acidiferrobacteraceae bacterium]
MSAKLTVGNPQATTLLQTRAATDKSLPFSVKVPNTLTRKHE